MSHDGKVLERLSRTKPLGSMINLLRSSLESAARPAVRGVRDLSMLLVEGRRSTLLLHLAGSLGLDVES